MHKPVVYLAVPYSNRDSTSGEIRERRYMAVSAVAAKLMMLGMNVFSPITHSHPLAVEFGLNLPAPTWWEIDEPYMAMCSAIFVLCLPGWDESEGVAREIEYFNNAGKPVFYLDEAAS